MHIRTESCTHIQSRKQISVQKLVSLSNEYLFVGDDVH